MTYNPNTYWTSGAADMYDLITTTANTVTNITYSNYIADPLIEWVPNSCLYVKYIPIWHLIKSYNGGSGEV